MCAVYWRMVSDETISPVRDETRHTLIEDAFALVTGAWLISFGLVLMKSAGIVTAGIAGLALLVSYYVPLGVGLLFFLINIPFFMIGLIKLGRAFMLRTIIAAGLIFVFSAVARSSLDIASIHPAFAALGGGTVSGLGLLVLLRHKTGVGGVNIIAIWMHQSRGWSVGRMQMALDGVILLVALASLDLASFGWSVLSMFAVNITLVIWHRPDRYTGY
tara:strand:- start:44517 stop:45167 length:651 start_codon:yes stop_codon:yes gene_type:complete